MVMFLRNKNLGKKIQEFGLYIIVFKINKIHNIIENSNMSKQEEQVLDF